MPHCRPTREARSNPVRHRSEDGDGENARALSSSPKVGVSPVCINISFANAYIRTCIDVTLTSVVVVRLPVDLCVLEGSVAESFDRLIFYFFSVEVNVRVSFVSHAQTHTLEYIRYHSYFQSSSAWFTVKYLTYPFPSRTVE